MKKYEDFEIVVTKFGKENLYGISVHRACGGKVGDASGRFGLEEIGGLDNVGPDEKENVEPDAGRHIVIQAAGPARFTFNQPEPLPIARAVVIGRRLSKAIFKDETEELWGQCKQYAKTNLSGLRIRLDLSRAPELGALPWEYMLLPNQDNFLTLDEDTSLVRYLQTADEIRPLRVIPPLRVLIVSSSPEGEPELALGDEIRNIEQAFNTLPDRQVEVTVLENATIDLLKSALDEAKTSNRPFQIFHFLGHGVFDEDSNRGMLIFEDTAHKAFPVSSDVLGLLLQPYRQDLRLIVLNSCEGARLSPADTYTSVAAKVMQIAEIPAAIAMQYRISDRAAVEFARALYESISAGEGLEYAIGEARRAVNSLPGDKKEWATPVVYLRAENGNLLDIRIPAVRPELEPHYLRLIEVLPKCEFVFFLGLNVNAVGRPSYEFWSPEFGMPTVAELCSYLGRQLKMPTVEGQSLAGLAQQILVRNKNVFNEFHPIFGKPRPAPQKTTKFYEVVAKLAKKVTDGLSPEGTDRLHKGLLFITTTYDWALEKAFIENGIERYHLLCYGRDENGKCFFSHRECDSKGVVTKNVTLDSTNMPNQYLAWRDKYPVILKLPGEVGDDETDYFAVTEDDFFSFAATPLSNLLPPDILTQIRDCRHLYLGFDVQNWTLRLLWSRLCEGQSVKGKKGSYAIVFKNDPNALFWREFGVSYDAATLDDYTIGLEQRVLRQL